MKTTANNALKRLREGNHQFASDVRNYGTVTCKAIRSDVNAGQAPFAIILGCSDSRVPAELVFSQGLGDLFVIRVAGNIVAPSQIGSVEFAAQHFGTRLVVVLGHTHCGAVKATLQQLNELNDEQDQSPNLRSIVKRIRPAVEAISVTDDEAKADPNALIHKAVRANIRASVNHLKNESDILKQLISNDGLLVVGAEYSLESGEVDFFDSIPNQS